MMKRKVVYSFAISIHKYEISTFKNNVASNIILTLTTISNSIIILTSPIL